MSNYNFRRIIYDLLPDTTLILAILCCTIMIYTFIINRWPRIRKSLKEEERKQREQQQLKEMGITHHDLYTQIHDEALLKKLKDATYDDLIAFLIKADNRQTHNKTHDQIDLVIHKVIKKTWTDSSLNCKVSSTDSLLKQDGWLIVWKYTDINKTVRFFEYHATTTGQWVRCGEVKVN